MPQSIPTWTSGSKVKPGIVFICRPWAKKRGFKYLALHATETASGKAHRKIFLKEGLHPNHGAETALGSVPSPLQMTQVMSFFCASLPPLDYSVQAAVSRRNHLWLCLCCSEFSGAQLKQYCNYLFLCCSSKSLIISLIEWPQKQDRAASPMHIHLIKMGLRDRAVTACIF